MNKWNFSFAVVLGLGSAMAIAKGWWTGIWMFIIPASILLILVASPVLKFAVMRALGPPSSAAVQAELERLRRNPQRRQLRHLVYEVAADWPNERGDDGVWSGVKFFVDPVRLILRTGVSPVIDDENMTQERLQAYARNHYENQLGMRVVGNEIGTFSGHWCVVTDALSESGGLVRRYSFTMQLSEYMVQFTFGTQEHFALCQPLMADLLDRCCLVTPKLVSTSALGGRVNIGLPEGCERTVDEDRETAWHGRSCPLVLNLHLLDEDGQTAMDDTVFDRLAGSHQGRSIRKISMEENGLSGLIATWSQHSPGNTPRRAAFAVRLPDGLSVVLDTDCKGKESDLYDGFNNMSIRLAILATLQPARVPIL